MDLAVVIALSTLSIAIVVHIVKITTAFTEVKTQLRTVMVEVEALRQIKHSFVGLDQRTSAFARFIEKVEEEYEELEKRVREIEIHLGRHRRERG